MELLLSKSPIVEPIHAHCVGDYFRSFVERSTSLNIATGFISNDSIAALKQIAEFRQGGLELNLLIGMNFLDGFTKSQYQATIDLYNYLRDSQIGNVYVSPSAMYHGKMYSFSDGDKCLGSFIGSSNLDSFVGSGDNYIESDLLLLEEEGNAIRDRIHSLIDHIGKPIQDVEVTKFKAPNTRLLDNYTYVEQVSNEEQSHFQLARTGTEVLVPLKTEAKSNLNTYFGAGKIKGRYSPRGWYEVEIIVSKNTPGLSELPDKESGPFTVITNDGYKFNCERQGDYSKNLRSSKDLKILGRWIKGQMEEDGALRVGQPVTEDTLNTFGKRYISFEKTSIDNTWLISLK